MALNFDFRKKKFFFFKIENLIHISYQLDKGFRLVYELSYTDEKSPPTKTGRQVIAEKKILAWCFLA
jgi:hypothetical protein